ncbi:hypothetical protein HAD_00105 [Hyphomonas adhaerens MHS-3]|uniref:Lipoprotein n=1 Tax=Hyphomonas adhaerens MHS-3 TaxID=1280949 RepID=A0A069E2N7_9PROT|nr:hypothetical protein [Hyphomonas adhaerens]KCZ84034.1 hypothetical protein HAD_00105 [Hyphomonas adhaerens MHS-3]
MKRPITLIAAAISLAALPALAENASTSDVYACKDITADAERLACYDTAVGRLKAAEEAGEVKTFTRKEVEDVQRDSFGFSIPSLPKLAFGSRDSGGNSISDELKEVTFPVTSVSGSRGALLVTLENGQVWRQVDSKRISPSPKKEARVYQAALGSFKMKLDGGLAFRVERVK